MNPDPAGIPAPTPRLDAAQLVDALFRTHGIGLDLVGRAPGGEVGAAFVRWPDGRDAVLTRAGDGSAESAAALRATADVLGLARSRGVPVPRYDLIAPVDGAHAVVQERLPGAVPHVVDARLVERMIAVTRTWSGLLAGRADLEPPTLHLTESGPGFCLHESLDRYDARTRRLLGQVRAVGREVDVLAGDDLVHLDFHPGNILVDAAGLITGVVDWDGWGRGDRWFSLEVLAFDLAWRRADVSVRDLLDELIAAAVDPSRLRAYRAHLSLRQVDWAIRHHGPGEVDAWLAIVADRLRP
ncbi:phosphotransferase family protein [Jiangella rhizosphaerae]|uniref:phosphotransferase family protein n=1 Tax=Jiangella rhizosphaerae TaxID=2293569 RepID=UPI0013143D02|nr:aminoglycoside phosphotransferase family protein [Jiangella rhizosphaerae]